MSDLAHEVDGLSVVVVVAFGLGAALLGGSALLAPKLTFHPKRNLSDTEREPSTNCRNAATKARWRPEAGRGDHRGDQSPLNLQPVGTKTGPPCRRKDASFRAALL